MPGGDDGEKKEETAESREEAKEQVRDNQVILALKVNSYFVRSASNSKP